MAVSHVEKLNGWMEETAPGRPVRDWLPALSRAASVVIMAMGALVLVGWAAGIRSLVTLLLPTSVAMNPMTAVLFLPLGFSLWLLAAPGGRTSKRSEIICRILGGAIALVGALQLADNLFDLGFRFEHLLFAHRVAAREFFPPSELAPHTALNFILCGLALALFDLETRRQFRPAQALLLVAAFIALLALTGYTYHVLSLYRLGSSEAMALDSAMAFALFCLGFLAARPRDGLMSVVTSPTTGGAVARRLLPVAILIPWLLGAVLLLGEQAGQYEREFAVSIFSVLCIVIFTGLIWWNAKLLYQVDVDRVRTERRMAVQHNSTRVLAETSSLETAIPGILRSIVTTLGWRAGAKWEVDHRAKTVRCVQVWSTSENGIAEFVETTRQSTFGPGEELPGRVWTSGQPLWISDLAAHRDLSRSALAAKVGLHGAFGFPIRLGQETLGMMEFFSPEVEPPDELLLDMLSGVGSQIGQFIERVRAEDQLRQTSANLARSNTELQQFANIASHDLFEPLRMVISYLQLLNDRYKAKLEPQAQEFISYAVDGAQRMQALIHDLLAYARVDSRGRPFEPTDCEQVLRAALSNLKVAIEETGTVVDHGPLPTVCADMVQLTQVFQNLIGNALKFHGAERPRIEVGARQEDQEWVFHVRDNGIGIDPKHFDRIFIIFQRLHTRHEYSGTGMGLAICKKIIERHGGRIWVESAPGKGATFLFTLPVMSP